MAKIKVSKLSYAILTAIFYTLCLSGMTWQLCLVSINYFEYKVFSDIKVLMPEKTKYETYFHFCNTMAQTVDIRTIAKYQNVNVSSEWQDRFNFERFNLTLGDQFLIEKNGLVVPLNADASTYIVGQNICYQFNNQSKSYFIPYKHVSKTWYVSFQLGHAIPHSDPGRILAYPHDPDIDNSKAIEIGDYSFYMLRLASPYSDDCINFESFGFASGYQAIHSCNFNENDEYKVSKYRLVNENETNILNMKVSKSDAIAPGCKRYDRDACIEQGLFTQILSAGKYKAIGDPVYRIFLRRSTHPSFKITSKPRIDAIDIVTYILGALGSWIGFSFLQLNPVPFFIRKDAEDRDKNADKELFDSRKWKSKRKIFHMKSIHEIRYAINSLAKDLDYVEDHHKNKIKLIGRQQNVQ